MDRSDWLTVPEVARRLGRSESTVRLWRKSLRGHLSERVGPHGYHVYDPAQFDVVARMAAERRSTREIAEALDRRSGQDRPPEPPDRVVELLTEIRDVLRQLLDTLGRG